MVWRKWVVMVIGLLLIDHSVYCTETLVLSLKKPQITQLRSLRFGSFVAGGALQLVIRPQDEGAALFELKGEPNARFQLHIVGNQLQVNNQATHNQIKISNFHFGGNVSIDGKGRFDSRGQLNNVRLGAVAQLTRQAKSGQYNGKSIVRITYF
ncbi:MAG: DUF4402 domain-containing protein [Coxiellaceae bacterium]|nr:DUF4402 domain-containing protein [Coxiellaceae bacterium]